MPQRSIEKKWSVAADHVMKSAQRSQFYSSSSVSTFAGQNAHDNRLLLQNAAVAMLQFLTQLEIRWDSFIQSPLDVLVNAWSTNGYIFDHVRVLARSLKAGETR